MSNKTTKEKIEIMQAFEDGKQIQIYNAGSDTWVDVPNPTWDWFSKDYRIKTENQDYKRGYDAALNDMYDILNGITEKHKLRAKDPFTRRADSVVAISDMASDYVRYIRELGRELGRLEEEDGK